ncbi:transposase [Psychrobacillus sp. NPDC096623]|uniref:transposase n=1 Tax=Psychrobacillus sp. NPDC096623 TaxID=3364492 RepID=UPI00380ED2A1
MKLSKEIKRVHIESDKIYGSPKITKQLKDEGISVSEKMQTSQLVVKQGRKPT